MLTAIEGTYADGRVELREAPQGIVRARVIVTFLPDAGAPVNAKPGADLYGIWKGKVPADVDVDALIQEIREQSAL